MVWENEQQCVGSESLGENTGSVDRYSCGHLECIPLPHRASVFSSANGEDPLSALSLNITQGNVETSVNEKIHGIVT